MSGPALEYDRFYDYDELTAFVHGWAEARPGVVAVESIGPSYEGRDIWLVTLTSLETGPPLEKPGFLVDGNMHSNEWTGSVAALHLIERLARGHGDDEPLTRLLDTRCVYVIPRLNPDGAERALRTGDYIRSSVRPYPTEEPQQGLHMKDVDGDGRVLFMRVADSNGSWRAHPDEPRLLVRRAADDPAGEGCYRVFPEGEVVGFDGVAVPIAPSLAEIDIGANLPADWSEQGKKPVSGAFPGSEPEIAALLRAVAERPNVAGYVSCHTFGGVVFQPPAEAGGFDDRVFGALAERLDELTGYHQLRYGGNHLCYFYEHLGVFSNTLELWSPFRAAGIDRRSMGPGWLGGDHPVEDELRLVRWSDEQLGGRGYVDWYPFDHPQLGPVELGGWDTIAYWYNAPFDRLEEEVRPAVDWIVWQALATPLLEMRALTAEPVGDELHRVRAVVQNAGWLPTYVSKKALEGYLVRPVTLELDGGELLSGERRVEVGQLEGRVEDRSLATWWGYQPGTRDLASAEWLVRAPAGTRVELTARHARAGTARATTTL